MAHFADNCDITIPFVTKFVHEFYGIEGEIEPLMGEIDYNFKIKSLSETFIIKFSRPVLDESQFSMTDELLSFLEDQSPSIEFPRIIRNNNHQRISEYVDSKGHLRKVRLLTWVEGRLWSTVKYKSNQLRYSLGLRCGEVMKSIQGFDKEKSQRDLDWDIANGLWIEDYLLHFKGEELAVLQYFLRLFKTNFNEFQKLRKGTIHNDANDNNVLVSYDLYNPECIAIIDYGDAVYSQLINDVAVSLAYSIMDCEDPLNAALITLKGYHDSFSMEEDELSHLYTCIGMRLAISVTKSSINRANEPDNEYLQISEKPAWRLLRKWANVSKELATYSFRKVCDLNAHPNQAAFEEYAINRLWTVKDLIQYSSDKAIQHLDLSIDSYYIGNYSKYIDSEELSEKIGDDCEKKKFIFVGGYGESRPLYTTDSYRIQTNSGMEYRTIHMGVDFWAKANTTVSSIENGEVVVAFDNDYYKDYGPTIIIKHDVEGFSYYSLYGHLSRESLVNTKVGDKVVRGQLIGNLGKYEENGGWGPHLHFQIMLDMLGKENNFYGVASPKMWEVFKSICPDPNLLFKIPELENKERLSKQNILQSRKSKLGKSLSLSYHEPIEIVRGQSQYLIDEMGQKYLDTVNNVAHVGHEHPRILKNAFNQMSLLNTNSRYLNKELVSYANKLLAYFPDDLCVVHFVNSGSEANELSLRMAKAYTGEKDIIALEVGYHGNTQSAIDVSSYKFDGKGGKGCPPYTHIVPLPDSYRGIYRGEETGGKYSSHISEVINLVKSEGRRIAGFIHESIVSCGGQIDLPKDYLKLVYGYIRAAGGICIADEVQVGFGRVGSKFWAYELHDVIPDIVTLGKPIGNGHPLGAVVCTRAVADAFANGMEFFNTFGGNPVSAVVGSTVLDIIEGEDLQKNALEVGSYLKLSLIQLKEKHSVIGDVRGEGLFLGIEFADATLSPLPQLVTYISERMKEHLILVSIDGPDHNVLKIKPPMCFNKDNADLLVSVLDKILSEVNY